MSRDEINDPRTFRWVESGVSGLARTRTWDVVASAEAPNLVGDEVAFTALPDGSLLVEGAPAAPLAPLAEAVEASLAVPYRARAVRRSHALWAVAAVAIDVVELRGDVAGDEVEVTLHEGERTVVVDGEPALVSVPALERYAEERFDSYVARAERLEGDLWEVQVLPL